MHTYRPSRFRTAAPLALIWAFGFSLANFRGTVFWDLLKQGFGISLLPWIEAGLWVVFGLLAVHSLIQDGRAGEYLSAWKRNAVLVPFLAIAALSVLWTISVPATVYKLAALLFSSLIGAYLGLHYSPSGLLHILFRFGTLLLIVCFALAIFLPVVGAMGPPYNGAWRGIFWHKNQFGGLAALFGLVFLVRTAAPNREDRPLVDLVFYLFTAVIIFFSRSVAGYMLFLLATSLVVLVFLWLRIRHRLRPVHYAAILGIGGLVVIAAWLNLDLIFGLFGRDTSLTGRLPLWQYLLEGVFSRRPWFGFGLGALWSSASFRISTQHVLGWPAPVAIADNGFLEILLHLGIAGSVCFMAVLLTAFARSYRYALRRASLPAFFPLLLMIFIVFANVSFSFFLETETFIWMLIVAVMFSLTEGARPSAG